MKNENTTTDTIIFKKLHRRLTLFCSLVTGAIFIALSSVCLLFAQQSIIQNNYNNFLTQLNTSFSHLQQQDIISQRWLGELSAKSNIQIYLYDNHKQLFHQNETANGITDALLNDCILKAQEYSVNIFPEKAKTFQEHGEFTYLAPDGGSYYVSAGYLPKNGGILSVLILSPRSREEKQRRELLTLFLCAGVVAIVVFTLFSYLFTGRVLRPLMEANQKQASFIASASHELRSPLAVIHSGLDAIKRADTPSEIVHFTGLLSEEAIHMERLVQQMLTLSAVDSGSLRLSLSSCQPDGILINTYEKYELLAHQKNIRLSMELPDKLLPDCLWDKERVEQVCSIITDNAISYTPREGAITLSLSQERSYIKIMISDTGDGIPDNEKELVFDRFYRVDKAHTDKTHYGLGLCIAKEIVTAHRGRIVVMDSDAGGCCFVVWLPVKG